MAVSKDDMSETAEKVTRKAATLVETAADLADQAFETTVDKADIAAAQTAFDLRQKSAKVRGFAHQNARKIGLVGIGIGTLAAVGGIAFAVSKARSRRSGSTNG